MKRLTLPILFMCAGCLRSAPPPNPGECASPPDAAVYTWGQIGIGTCLAGPTDLSFIEQDGRTFLAVTNANPYVDFENGSLLLIDWSSVDPTRDRNYMHELRASALMVVDYVGGFGYLPDRRLGILPGRLSPGAAGTSANDRTRIIDMSDPDNLSLWAPQPRMTLRDDPQPVVVDSPNGRAYIGNLTDHSVTVLDTTGEILEKVDVAPGPVSTALAFYDADASGSTAEIDTVDLSFPDEAVDDTWTLSWAEGTARIWVPEPTDEGEVGLHRYTDVGLGPVANAMGIEVDPADFGAFTDASVTAVDGIPLMWFSDPDGAAIYRIAPTGLQGDWAPESLNIELASRGPDFWDSLLGGPSLALVDEVPTLFYDGRKPEGSPAIGATTAAADGLYVHADAPLLDPAEFDGISGLSDPHAWEDVSNDSLLLYMTVTRDDGSTAIGRALSPDNGLTWEAPEVVLDGAGRNLSKPVIHRRHGQFQLWYTVDDGASWSHERAWSWDGVTWFEPELLLASEVPYTPGGDPPGQAVLVETVGAWTLEGVNQGPIDALLFSGSTFFNSSDGYSLRLASGYEFPNNVVPDGRAKLGLVPGSYLQVDGVPTLFATAEDDARTRLVALQETASGWTTLSSDLIPAGIGGNRAGVSHPVVVPSETGFTLFYAAADVQGVVTIRRATSADGVNWSPIGGPALDDGRDWDSVEQYPGSVQILDDGTIRLWYTGFNGSRYRIGTAVAADPEAALTPQEGEFDPWVLGQGVPGGFDDGGVKDPVVFSTADGVTHLLYAGFDGTQWGLGHGILEADGDIVLRIDAESDRSLPAMTSEPNSFSHRGVSNPVLHSLSDDGSIVFFYAGFDGVTDRIGLASGRPERPWPQIRYPTVGDTLEFVTAQGRTGASVIELAQSNGTFATPGTGMSGMTLDPERGMLYIPSKLESYLYIVDVRDDSGGVFVDSNQLDLEGLLQVEAFSNLGFRDALVDYARDRLYLSGRNPDAVVIADLTSIVDDAVTDVTYFAPYGQLPLQDLRNDAGANTLSATGGSGMALSNDGRYLIVAHHRGNGIAIFDLDMGFFGTEVAWISDVGENPHDVAVSPDGRYAVVANYTGEVAEDGLATSSTLVVVDLDPQSPTFLEAVTWLVNK